MACKKHKFKMKSGGKIPEYGLGGWLKKQWDKVDHTVVGRGLDFGADYAKAGTDRALSMFGLRDAIDDESYGYTTGGKARKDNLFWNWAGPAKEGSFKDVLTRGVATLALNSLVPGLGTGLQVGGTAANELFKDSEDSMFTNLFGNFETSSTEVPQIPANNTQTSTNTAYMQPAKSTELDKLAKQKYYGGLDLSPDNPYAPTFATGGIQKYQYGTPNAELESEEVFRTPDGNITEISKNAPTHNQGGVEMSLPSGTQILGKNKSRYSGKEFKKMAKGLDAEQARYNKILNNPNSSQLARRTAKLMLDKTQNKFSKLLAEQEIEKGNYHTMPNGTIMEGAEHNKEYAKGGIYIKPSKKGTFKAQASKMGMGIQEAASKILNAPEGKYSSAMRKKANFAKNFAKANGGVIKYANGIEEVPGVDMTGLQQSPYFSTSETGNTGPSNLSGLLGNVDISKILGGVKNTALEAAVLSPILYNFYQGMNTKPVQLDPSQYQIDVNIDPSQYQIDPNAYESPEVLNALKSTTRGVETPDVSYDINPELRRSRTAFRSDLRNTSGISNIGQRIAALRSARAAQSEREGDLFTKKRNIETQARERQAARVQQDRQQYLQNLSSLLESRGRTRAQIAQSNAANAMAAQRLGLTAKQANLQNMLNVQNFNLQSRELRNQQLATATGQLSDYAQNKQLQQNQQASQGLSQELLKTAISNPEILKSLFSALGG